MSSLRWLYFFLALALALYARVVFIPLFLSIFSAILLEPFISLLIRRNVPRQFACTVVILGFLGVIAGVLWLGYFSVASLGTGISNFSEKLEHFSSWLQMLNAKLKFSAPISFDASNTRELIQKVQVIEPYPAWTVYLISGAGSFFEIASVAVFVPLLLFYFLYDKENLLESFNALAGKYCYLPKLNFELPRMIRAYVMANMLTLSILAFVHGLTLFYLGFNNWISLALITGFLSLMPLVGAPLAILLPLTQGVADTQSAFPLLVMAFAFLAFHLIANNLILPQLIGSRINVNSASLLFGLLFWGWLWGAMGFVLAVPMTALLKIFLESNPHTVPIANLLSAKPNYILKN